MLLTDDDDSPDRLAKVAAAVRAIASDRLLEDVRTLDPSAATRINASPYGYVIGRHLFDRAVAELLSIQDVPSDAFSLSSEFDEVWTETSGRPPLSEKDYQGLHRHLEQCAVFDEWSAAGVHFVARALLLRDSRIGALKLGQFTSLRLLHKAQLVEIGHQFMPLSQLQPVKAAEAAAMMTLHGALLMVFGEPLTLEEAMQSSEKRIAATLAVLYVATPTYRQFCTRFAGTTPSLADQLIWASSILRTRSTTALAATVSDILAVVSSRPEAQYALHAATIQSGHQFLDVTAIHTLSSIIREWSALPALRTRP